MPIKLKAKELNLLQEKIKSKTSVAKPITTKKSTLPKAVKNLKTQKLGSKLETKILDILLIAGFPSPTLQYKFCESRKWRFDFCWIDKKIALEIDGETSHARWQRVTLDAQKRNVATANGWQVFTITGQMIKSNPWQVLDILKIKLLNE